LARKGKKTDIPEDHVPPEPPVLVDHFREKVLQFQQAMNITPDLLNKWAKKDSPERRAIALAVLRCGHTFKMAAEVIGVDRRTLENWRIIDGVMTPFGLECEDAYDQGTDAHEEEFLRRARDGVLQPVYQGGVLVGHTRQFSDSLMQMLMAGRRSRVYGKQKVEMTGEGGGPVAHVHKMEIEFVKPKLVKDDD